MVATDKDKRTLWERVKEDVYILDATQEERLYFKDLYKTQKQIDTMEQEDIDVLNSYVDQWTSEAAYKLRQVIYDNYDILRYARKRYKQLKSEGKDKHPMWRSRGTVELVMMETGLPITKFTTGFEVTIGDTRKTLLELRLSFDKKTYRPQLSQWYRVYKKTKVLTPEEREELIKQRIKELAEKRESSYLRNYEKLGLKKTWLHKKFQGIDGIYEVLGLEMKNKKMPVVTVFTADDPNNADNGAVFNCTVRFITSKKQVKDMKGQ